MSPAAGVPAGAAPSEPLLAVRDLDVVFPTEAGEIAAADAVAYDLAPGRVLGVVGESGCGKTVTALALLRLVPPPGRIAGGAIRFENRDLLALGPAEMREVRGARISMIFQEPMTALNPVFTVGDQIAETLLLHRGLSRAEAWQGAVEMLERVGMPAPARRANDYPHRLSGGMRQRAMIAIALACRPALLIADEPTTALDVTIQAQIFDLMLDLRDEMGMAMLFISHNLAVVSEVADEVMVMYAGRVVERAPAAALFAQPLHPYTRALMATVPELGRRKALHAIPGNLPNPLALPPGCRFSDRCPLAGPECRAAEPQLEDKVGGRLAACLKAGQ